MTAARSAAAISAAAARFIVSGYGGSPGRGPPDRAVGVVVDAPGLDLAEVDVVDGAEAAAQRARPGGAACGT